MIDKDTTKWQDAARLLIMLFILHGTKGSVRSVGELAREPERYLRKSKGGDSQNYKKRELVMEGETDKWGTY
jgi:hypothetical protein